MAYSILKSADIVPEEMELLRQIECLNQTVSSSENPTEKKMLQQQLAEKVTSFKLRMEHNGRNRR